MLNINENILLNRAGSSGAYTRGKAYYNENRIIDLRSTFEHDHFQGIVKGGRDYDVTVKFYKNGQIKMTECTCPAFDKYRGDCKHIIAVLTYIMELNLSENQREEDEESIRNIIDFYRGNDSQEKTPVNVEFNYEFKLNSLNDVEEGSYLRLRIGEDRLYVVKSMKEFFKSLKYKEEVKFSKFFTFSPYEHEFKEEDQEIMDFLMLLYENYSMNSSRNRTLDSESIFRNRELMLTPVSLKEFFKLMKDRSFNVKILDQEYEDVVIVEEDILLNMDIHEEGKDLLVSLESEKDIVSLTDDGEYFFMDNKIYKLSKAQRTKILPVYEEIIRGGNGSLRVSDRYKETFISEVLPSIKNVVNLNIDENVEKSIYNPELNAQVYFDKQDDIIIGEAKFVYGDITINPFSSKVEDSRNKERILLRDIHKERHLLKLLEESEFKVTDGEIYMEDEENIFDLIYYMLPELNKFCDIYYSDSFNKISIKDSSYFSGGIKIDEDWDILEFNFNIDGIDTFELDEVFIALEEKKKYFRLKDGSFLPLDNPELDSMKDIMDYLDLNWEDFDNGIIPVPKFKSMYLDKYLEEKRLSFIRKNVNFKKLVQDIKEPEDIEYEIPEELQGTLRDYQKSGFKWLKTLSKYGFGGILADDMGLGKTLQVLTFLLSEKKERGSVPSLIVVPSSLVYNWESEIQKFTPDLKSLVVAGTKEERLEIVEDVLDYDVIITSYPLIRRDIELYKDVYFRYCILDEAQNIKNHNSLNAKSVKSIKAQNYFALTGTPMENSLIELWSIFDFLMPGYLLSNRKFAEKFETPIFKDQDKKALKDLNNHIEPFILRRLKKDVLKELPDKIEQKIVVEMSMEQKKLYLAYLKAIKGEIEEEIDHKGFGRSHIKILTGLTRLRQICCHPKLFVEDYVGGSGKLDSLREILKDAIDGGHRILLFSQFTSMLSIIKEMLDSENIEYMYLDGSTDIKERGNLVKEFNDGRGQVFLISLKAGGTGLNLTGADMVIHFDPWWNPAVEDQATDRAHRIGQENTVQVIKLITKGTIEEKIFELQEKKKEMIDKVITEGETLVSKLSEEEIMSLFQLE